MDGYVLHPTGRGGRSRDEVLAPEEALAAERLLDALPIPVLWIRTDHSVHWRNRVARDVYGVEELPCHRLVHGYPTPCESHGESCPMRLPSYARGVTAVHHLHEGRTGQGFYRVSSLRVAPDDLLELHWPLDEVLLRDVLTGVFTRRFFEQMAHHGLELMKRMGQPFSLLLLDVDGLKKINDRYGHAAGDAALRLVGRVLLACARVSDVVGRLGGDEFCAFLPATEPCAATSVARRIRAHLHDARSPDLPKDLRLSVSIGIAGGTRSYDLDIVRRTADRALYRAKTKGRDRIAIA